MKTDLKTWLVLAMCAGAGGAWAHDGEHNLLPIAERHSSAEETNRVSITIEGGFRIIHANGIPDHATGSFPNRHNPHRIMAQNYMYKVLAKPVVATRPTPLGMHPFGIGLNGVVFDPGAAEWWNRDPRSGWQYEPMHMDGRLGADQNNAHVQPSGAYHYHAIPTGLLHTLSAGKTGMTLLGWAADGFPIYGPNGYANPQNSKSLLKELRSSYRLKQGTRAGGPGGKHDGTFVGDYEFVKGSGDLDECNGRFGVTPEFPEGTYYYVLTKEFPFIPRQFKGTPDSSFMRKGPPGGNGRRPGPPPNDRPERRDAPPGQTRSLS